jgi:hypothetical protein
LPKVSSGIEVAISNLDNCATWSRRSKQKVSMVRDDRDKQTYARAAVFSARRAVRVHLDDLLRSVDVCGKLLRSRRSRLMIDG